MQDLLAKIIEMDENARKIKEEAELDKIKSENEIKELRQKIYDDYIERAKERVEKNIAVDQQRSDEALAAYRENINRAKEKMLNSYTQNKDKWVGEIVERALSS